MHIVDDPDLHVAEKQWLHGGSALPLVSMLIARGDDIGAGAIARAALERGDCEDPDSLERILEQLSQPPDDWCALLDDFASAPSIERWRALMRFVPDELMYERLRHSVRYLKTRMDGDLLFLCACDLGLIPDAIAMVEEGLVSARTLAQRASRAGGARATYTGLAAQSAFVAGDLVGTIRYLRDSIRNETAWCSSLPHIWFIRERASDAENLALDQARIPRIPLAAQE